MTEETKHWFTARKGSTLHWFPKDRPIGILELNPEHEPILHWLGGASEVLKPTSTGAYVIDIPNPSCTFVIEVGKGDQTFEQDITYVEMKL
jgi:hypothetical protein